MKTNKFSKLDDRYEKIKANFADQQTFTLSDIRNIFSDTNAQTIAWDLHYMVQNKKIFKVGHGEYSLLEMQKNLSLGYDYISEKSKQIYDILQEFGYNYYISGIDALSGELLHVPEKYPSLIVIEKDKIREMQEHLINSGYNAISENDKGLVKHDLYVKRADIIIISGKNFDLAYQGIANKEKAFADLYYAVTRLEYPFSIQELIRTYENMLRKNTVLNLELRKAASELKIKDEIEYILGIKKMTPKTREFIGKLLKDGGNS